MEKQLISYLILPKGIQSMLFKLYAYFIPFLYSLIFSENYWENLLWFLLIFFLFEFIINPSLYQFNDLIDYTGDQQREHHWQRPVNKNNRRLILAVAISRFIFGTILAFVLDVKFGYLAILFLILQFFYDHFAKKYSPFTAILAVTIAYPLRSLTILYGLEIKLDQTAILLLLSIFLYATYMVFQWRKNESFFILNKKLISKPHSEFFSSPKINSLIFIKLLLFLVVFIQLITSLAKLDLNNASIIYAISLVFIIIFFLANKNIFKKIINQSHNIFMALVFVALTLDKFFIALIISIITIFILIWYHRIYVERFAKNYFNENHYDKI